MSDARIDVRLISGRQLLVDIDRCADWASTCGAARRAAPGATRAGGDRGRIATQYRAGQQPDTDAWSTRATAAVASIPARAPSAARLSDGRELSRGCGEDTACRCASGSRRTAGLPTPGQATLTAVTAVAWLDRTAHKAHLSAPADDHANRRRAAEPATARRSPTAAHPARSPSRARGREGDCEMTHASSGTHSRPDSTRAATTAAPWSSESTAAT